MLTFIACCVLAVVDATAYRVVSDTHHNSAPSPGEIPNFYLRQRRADTSTVTYEHWRGRWTTETVNEHADSVEERHMHRGLIRLVQSTNGHHLVMNIYDSVTGELVDCDLQDEREAINAFIRHFIEQTTPILNTLDTQPANTTTYRQLGGVRDAKDEPLMQFGAFKRECRIYRARTSTDNETSEAYVNETAVGLERRVRRSSRGNSVLITPGTQWCGAGSSASHSGDIRSPTDHCCQQHDKCPYSIGGMTRRFGYFNYRFYTMSYCECDKQCVRSIHGHGRRCRFHACLKRVDSGTSNMVGNVFFNVVNRSCFRLRRDRQCAKRSWFGVCNRYRRALQANVDDSLRY